MNKSVTKILLLLIVFMALGLRIYKLDSVPPAISWDEAAVGYNAWTIANYGKDEYGKPFPLFFKSFGDDKHPVHIYSTAVFVKLLGLSEFSIRLPSAVFGTLNVLLIYFLTNLLFKNRKVSLIAAAFLAISPQNIHFSRFNHEANFALFFFLLGLILFYMSLKKMMMLPLATLSFAISFLTYHPSKVIVPFTMVVLFLLYSRTLFQAKMALFFSLVIISLLALLIFFTPPLLGLARINQTSIAKESSLLGKITLYLTQYSWHFSPTYLFISGDKNPRLSSQTGEFYKIEALFLILGFIYLIRNRSKGGILVLVWALISPIPSALVAEAPHAARSIFMMGSWQIISALGLYSLVSAVRKKTFQRVTVFVVSAILILSLFLYLKYYFGEYTKRYAIEWQYGMKQVVEFAKEHQEYSHMFMTDIRSQPYIFFLYYLKVPLPEYLNTVVYNRSEENKSYNTVSYFSRYYFGGWNPIDSSPDEGMLYIITDSQYDGLKNKFKFDVKKIIYYPNGSLAFYLVSKK
ncbi:glycosyltransferase family 39 protein [Candidatus Daviesbacteria bacterium]|nr:glycosyltransferase family 39 protein [Candidatus Daviesbacteria bacterium]